MIAQQQNANRLVDGGGDYTKETVTYVSATSFKLNDGATDWTNIFTPGTKLEINDNGTVKYSYCISSSSASSETTVSTSNWVTSANVVSNLSGGALSGLYAGNLCKLRGHPNWINYTPTYGGFSSNPTESSKEFMCLGNYCIVNLQHSGGGTSNANTFTWSLPIAATSTSGYVAQCPTPFQENNGSTESNRGYGQVVASATSCSMFRASTVGGSASGSAWTSSGFKRCRIELRYRIG